ncbi:MAG: hypothetical protein WD556_03265 [Actinomycetota bacterium]
MSERSRVSGPRWVTPDTARAHKDVFEKALGRDTFWGLIHAGEIAVLKIGRRTLVDMESVVRFAEGQGERAGADAGAEREARR